MANAIYSTVGRECSKCTWESRTRLHTAEDAETGSWSRSTSSEMKKKRNKEKGRLTAEDTSPHELFQSRDFKYLLGPVPMFISPDRPLSQCPAMDLTSPLGRLADTYSSTWLSLGSWYWLFLSNSNLSLLQPSHNSKPRRYTEYINIDIY